MHASTPFHGDTADRLDRQIVHALHIHGRASFEAIGGVLGVSDQTVARRYQRLAGSGLLRVRGLVEPSRVGSTQWIARITTAPPRGGDGG